MDKVDLRNAIGCIPLSGGDNVAIALAVYNGTLSDVSFPRLADAGHGYSYIAPERLPVELRILGAEIAAAVESGSPITMLYRDQKGEETTRTVTPYGWALVRGTPMRRACPHCETAVLYVGRREYRKDPASWVAIAKRISERRLRDRPIIIKHDVELTASVQMALIGTNDDDPI